MADPRYPLASSNSLSAATFVTNSHNVAMLPAREESCLDTARAPIAPESRLCRSNAVSAPGLPGLKPFAPLLAPSVFSTRQWKPVGSPGLATLTPYPQVSTTAASTSACSNALFKNGPLSPKTSASIFRTDSGPLSPKMTGSIATSRMPRQNSALWDNVLDRRAADDMAPVMWVKKENGLPRSRGASSVPYPFYTVPSTASLFAPTARTAPISHAAPLQDGTISSPPCGTSAPHLARNTSLVLPTLSSPTLKPFARARIALAGGLKPRLTDEQRPLVGEMVPLSAADHTSRVTPCPTQLPNSCLSLATPSMLQAPHTQSLSSFVRAASQNTTLVHAPLEKSNVLRAVDSWEPHKGDDGEQNDAFPKDYHPTASWNEDPALDAGHGEAIKMCYSKERVLVPTDHAPVCNVQSNSVPLGSPVLHTNKTRCLDSINNLHHVTYGSTSIQPVGSTNTAAVVKRLIPATENSVGDAKCLSETATLMHGEARKTKDAQEVVNIASPERSLHAPLGQRPAPRAYHRSCMVGDSLWLYGGTQDTSFGYTPFDDLYELNLNSRSPDYLLWVKHDFPGGPGPRCKHAMASYEKKIYIFGGWDGNRRCNDVFIFDTTSNTWSQAQPPNGRATQANWPAPHTSHAQYVVGSIWVIVGRGETGTHKKYGCDIDFFDFIKHRWTLGGARFNSRAGHTLSLMCDGKTMCMVGGRKESPVEFFDVDKYAPNNGFNLRLQAECNSYADTVVENEWHVDNLLCRGPPYGRSFHGAANVTSTEGCTFPWFVCHGGFLEGNISTQRCLFDATDETVIYDALHDAWYTPQNVDLPPRGAHCLEMKLQTNSDGAKVAQLILFGGTHRGRVFNDLWIAELPLTDNDENVPRSNCNLGQKAKSFDPKAFQLELNCMTRIQKSEKSQQVKREMQMEKQKKNSLRDMRGIQMRLNLQKKERIPKCPDRVRMQANQKHDEAAKVKGPYSASIPDLSMPASARSPHLYHRGMFTARSPQPTDTPRSILTDVLCTQSPALSTRTTVAPASAAKKHEFNPSMRRASSGAIMVSSRRSPRSSKVTHVSKGADDRPTATNKTVKSAHTIPASAAPVNAVPVAAAPVAAIPVAAVPFAASELAADPVTAAPVTAAPVTAAPATAAPVTAAPVTAARATADPVTAAPVTAAPVTAAPATAAPATVAPVPAAPVTAAPVTAAPVAAPSGGEHWPTPVSREASNVVFHTTRMPSLIAPHLSSACKNLTLPASTAINTVVLGGRLRQMPQQELVQQVGSLSNKTFFAGQVPLQPLRSGGAMVGSTFARCLVSPRPHYRYLPTMSEQNDTGTTQLVTVAERTQLQDGDIAGQNEGLDAAALLRNRSMVSLRDGLLTGWRLLSPRNV